VLPLARIARLTPAGKAGEEDLVQALTREHLEALVRLTAPWAERVEIQHEVLFGTGFIEVIRKVLARDHDLLVKTAENPSFLQRLFGGDDMQLLRECPCPVWLTHPEEKADYESIVATVDFDTDVPGEHEADLNAQILEFASAIALSDPADLHILHVWDAPAEMMLRHWSSNPAVDGASYARAVRSDSEKGMKALADGLRQLLGDEAYDYLAPDYHLMRGSATTMIPTMARELDADLIVMGTVGRSGIAGLFIGNTAELVLEQVNCSVLAVKPPGFVSPVRLDA
jgi:nucleotide-binding universal stress UspA family protein